MLFWIIALILIVTIVSLISGGSNDDPLGGDGGSGCFNKGCLIRMTVLFLMLVILVIFYFFMKGF